MVRSALTYGVLVGSVLAFASPATAAQEEPGGETENAGVPPASAPRPAETPSGKVTACGVCANETCTLVRLRGLCTVDEALKALAGHPKAAGPGADGARHRSRAVTGADYEPLVLDETPEPGRAKAAPKHHPQEGAGGAPVQAPDGLTPGVHKSDSLSVKAQSFRPLDLNEEPADDEGASGETEEEDR